MIVEVIDVLRPFGSSLKAYGQLEVPNGSWIAEGEILSLLPSDRPIRNPGTSGVPFLNETFIMAAAGEAAQVSRYTKHISYERWDNHKELAMRAKNLWVSNEPFAILVIETSSLPGEKRDLRFKAKMSMRLFWSRQIDKDGEIEGFIPTKSLPVVTGEGKNSEQWSWVSLCELAKVTSLEPRDIARGFLSLKMFSADSTSVQPSFVHAENVEALRTGKVFPFPNVVSSSGRPQLHYLAPGPANGAEIEAENVWVALASSEKVQRIIALGIKNSHELIPTMFV